MANSTTTARSGNGLAAGALISGAVALLALPSAVLAFTVNFNPATDTEAQTESGEIQTDSDPSMGLARAFSIRSLAKGQLFPFTPAETPSRPDRSVTVAVRIDSEAARGLTVKRPSALAANPGEGPVLRIAPTAFNLGVSRGYTNFAQNIVRKEEKSTPAFPDLAKFSIADGTAEKDSRFSPRIVIDETATAGRVPRTFAGDSDDLVDVGGSYRVAGNLDVTAGVRYSLERERLLPVTDGKQDNQAVYVGTQFRF